MRGFLRFVGWTFLVFIGLSILGGIIRLFQDDDSEVREANIGVIEVEGVITESLPILEQIKEFRDHKNLKALVLRVDTPGGAVGASQEIFLEIKKLKEKFPVVVSMGDLAASGGLYVAIAGSHIFALPGTLTGSMGVLLELTQIHRLLEKIYIDPVTLKSGALKDAGNPIHPISSEAKAYLQSLISSNFETFKKTVATERKLSPETVSLLSDGRVVSGEDAVKMKLVDAVGTFQDAVDHAKGLAKIEGDANLAYLSRKKKDLWERIVEQAVSPVHAWFRASEDILQYRFDPRVR